MNAIDLIFSKPVFQALGWALINFVWQGTVVAMILATANIFLQRRSANARYVAACIALIFMLVLPIGTALFSSPKSLTSSSVLSSDTSTSDYQKPRTVNSTDLAQAPNTTIAAPAQPVATPFIQT